jgi:hypothetical protein
MSFLLCRQILEDPRIGECILVAPTLVFRAFEYPAVATFAAYTQWTSARGSYRMQIRLQTLEGQPLHRHTYLDPVEIPNPLDVRAIALHDCRLVFPAPGKYEVALLANDDVLTKAVFWAYVQQPRGTILEPPAERPR